jgi:fibronectin type 3 domain-containing protein
MRRVVAVLLLACLLPWTANAGQNRKHSVTLKWNPPVAQAGGTVVAYNIYRSEQENGPYQLIARKISSLTYTDTTVKSRHTYHYKVTSIDAKGRESTAVTTKAAVP